MRSFFTRLAPFDQFEREHLISTGQATTQLGVSLPMVLRATRRLAPMRHAGREGLGHGVG